MYKQRGLGIEDGYLEKLKFEIGNTRVQMTNHSSEELDFEQEPWSKRNNWNLSSRGGFPMERMMIAEKVLERITLDEQLETNEEAISALSWGYWFIASFQ